MKIVDNFLDRFWGRWENISIEQEEIDEDLHLDKLDEQLRAEDESWVN